METSMSIIDLIKLKFPKLYVTETTNNSLVFPPEQSNGHIEYKRTLMDCTKSKIINYATQMRWRISENTKNQSATYYIGINDNGSVYGLSKDCVFGCVEKFVTISQSIDASITCVQIIYINDCIIIKIVVKNKKLKDNYLVDFSNEF